MPGFEIFRDKSIASGLIDKIHSIADKPIVLMEVCGGHTMAIQRFGIPSVLPDTVKLISGPGCPVCVTGIEFVDQSIAMSDDPNNIIVTYGDMIRVPGTTSTLENQRAEGADIRIISSPLEALKISENNSDKNIIFLGVGFETTTPATAITVIEAERRGIKNFYLHSAHKIMPPALRALADKDALFDGLIAPGHVSVITGTDIYQFLSDEFSIGCVISGFEPVDILQSIYMLVKQKAEKSPAVEIQYTRVVKREGNIKAREAVDNVFEKVDQAWRGLGVIEKSGLALREEYKKFDAISNLTVKPYVSREPKGCRCGEVMKGIISPFDCPLFSGVCKPEHPIGACMVSTEGSCHAYYRYSKRKK